MRSSLLYRQTSTHLGKGKRRENIGTLLFAQISLGCSIRGVTCYWGGSRTTENTSEPLMKDFYSAVWQQQLCTVFYCESLRFLQWGFWLLLGQVKFIVSVCLTYPSHMSKTCIIRPCQVAVKLHAIFTTRLTAAGHKPLCVQAAKNKWFIANLALFYLNDYV